MSVENHPDPAARAAVVDRIRTAIRDAGARPSPAAAVMTVFADLLLAADARVAAAFARVAAADLVTADAETEATNARADADRAAEALGRAALATEAAIIEARAEAARDASEEAEAVRLALQVSLAEAEANARAANARAAEAEANARAAEARAAAADLVVSDAIAEARGAARLVESAEARAEAAEARPVPSLDDAEKALQLRDEARDLIAALVRGDFSLGEVEVCGTHFTAAEVTPIISTRIRSNEAKIRDMGFRVTTTRVDV